MWNSGITFRQRSAGVSPRLAAILSRRGAQVRLRERHQFGPRRGSRGMQQQGDRIGSRLGLLFRDRRAGRKPKVRVQFDQRHAPGSSRRTNRRIEAGLHHHRRRAEVGEIEVELRLAVGGIEWRAGAMRRDSQEGRRHRGSVRAHQRHPVSASDPQARERAAGPRDLLRQPAKRQRRASRREQRDRRRVALTENEPPKHVQIHYMRRRRVLLIGALLLAVMTLSTVRIRRSALGWGNYWSVELSAPWRR